MHFNVNQYVKLIAFLLNAPLVIATMFAIGFNYQQIIRWMISISIFILISAIAYYLILKYDIYSNSTALLKSKLFNKYGAFAGLIYIVIQFLQVTIIPLPAALTTVAGVALSDFGNDVAIQHDRNNKRIDVCLLFGQKIRSKTYDMAMR